MALVKLCFFVLLNLAWVITGAAQYDTCSGNLIWVGDGYCDPSTNTPECQHDGGDCCSCTCLDGPIYTCGYNGYDCKDATCIDPNLQAEYPYCDGNLLSWNDGKCDAENNNEICGHDGGDCCLCACVSNGQCHFSSFDCVDPSAEDPVHQCQPSQASAANCSVEAEQTWMVENTAQARALAEELKCSGGTFEVLWKGFVTVNTTITVANGTVLNITGVQGPSSAVIYGGHDVQLLTVVNASLHISDVGLNSGSSVVGGAITVSASNVTLTRTHFSGDKAKGMGGALYVTEHSTVVFDGNETSFINNSAVELGGAMYAQGSCTIRFSGEENHFLHNVAEERGGAIAIEQSDLWFMGRVHFDNNTGGFTGGAINVADGSSASWNGSVFFTRNAAEFGGGALAVYRNSLVSWSGKTYFESNQAVARGGAIIIDGANVSWVGNTRFASNAASFGGAISANSFTEVSWSGVSVFVNNTSKEGGAILIELGSSVRWEGSNTTFASNTANRLGGAILSDDSNVSWKGYTTFEHNRAHLAGGAMFIFNGDVSWSEDTSFVSNQANVSGGALHVDSAHVSWDGNTMFESNSAAGIVGVGGALSSNLAANISWSGFTSFSNNSAGTGGALEVSTDSSISWSGPKTVFESNTAASSTGGAIFSVGSNISWTGYTILRNNRANSSGGAIHVAGLYLPINGTSVVASNTENLFLASAGELRWSGTTSFINNSAVSGGAMTVLGANVSWSGLNTTFAFNKATRFGGGAIGAHDSSLSWSGVTVFRNNIATSSFGGGIFVSSKYQIEWKGDTMFTGKNAVYGGAIYIYQEIWVKWTGRTFVSNKANEEGGAIGSIALDASADGNLVSFLFIYGTTTFVDNVCYLDGGAISMAGGLFVEFDPAVNVTFWGNSAGAAGGAIFMSGANVGPTFGKVSFMFNSTQLGGGVYATSSGNARIDLDGRETKNPTTFDQCSFIGNTAFATGGAIQSAAGEDSMLHTLFSGNTAKVGGALYLAGTSSFYNCSFVDNVADEDSGPVIWNIGYIASMPGSSFAGNTYNCAPGTFLAYIKSNNLYESLCADCDASCELGCYFEDPSTVPYCEAVLTHSSSNGSSATIEGLWIDPGYWRATTTSENVLACYHPDACEGGVTGASDYCREGYEGPYCAICSDGYTEGPGFTCDKCSSSNAGIALIVVVSTVAVLSITLLGRYLASGELERTRCGFVQRLMRFIPLQTVKIIIVAWQILTQFASVANVTYPSVYQRFLDGVTVLNFDLSWVLSVGCVLDLDFHGRLLFATLGPIVAVVMLGVTFSVATLRNHGSDRALENIRYKHVSAVLLLTFLVYSSVSSIIFQTFACDGLDDCNIYLRADYRIQCDSPKHEAFQIYAGFMIVLYAFGIPALYAILLFKDRELLANKSGGSNTRDTRDNNTRVYSTSSLWKPYKPKRFYYEVIECFRRILLTGIVVFIYPNTVAQIAMSLIVSFTFTLLFEALNPYSSTWDTWVSRMGHTGVFVSVFLALLLKVDVSDERSESQTVFEAILVFVQACMILVVLGEALVLACLLRVERQEDPSPRFRRMKWIDGKRDADVSESEVSSR